MRKLSGVGRNRTSYRVSTVSKSAGIEHGPAKNDEKMLRIEMMRLLLEDRDIKPFRLDQPRR
jgi:hypothetical protein